MSKYRAFGKVVGTKYLGEFEADTPEEAKEKAENSEDACVILCYSCISECEDPEIVDVEVEKIIDGE